MMARQRSKRGPAGAWLWLSALFVALALSGCIFSPEKKKKPDIVVPYPVATSPGNVLAIVKRAYEERKIEEFEKIFATEYVFQFSPEDIVQGNTPAEWPRNDEIDSARNMFGDDTVDRIEMTSFIIPAPRAAVESDNLPSIEGVQVITIDAVRLSVFTRNLDGEVLELLVPGEQAVFFFLETQVVDPASGRKLWELIRWRDKPTGGFTAIKQTFATQ